MSKKFVVKKDQCIGCGACVAIADAVFAIGDDGLAEAINEEVREDKKELAEDAANGCPTGAIEIE